MTIQRISAELVEEIKASYGRVTTLNLASNDIVTIENLERLSSIRKLDLSNNRISSLDGLEHLARLEELENVRDLRPLRSLHTLHLGSNRISDPEEILTLAQQLPTLQRIVLRGNPVCEKIRSYRKWAVLCFPNLTELDYAAVSVAERTYYKLEAAENRESEDNDTGAGIAWSATAESNPLVENSTGAAKGDTAEDHAIQGRINRGTAKLQQENSQLQRKNDVLEQRIAASQEEIRDLDAAREAALKRAAHLQRVSDEAEVMRAELADLRAYVHMLGARGPTSAAASTSTGMQTDASGDAPFAPEGSREECTKLLEIQVQSLEAALCAYENGLDEEGDPPTSRTSAVRWRKKVVELLADKYEMERRIEDQQTEKKRLHTRIEVLEAQERALRARCEHLQNERDSTAKKLHLNESALVRVGPLARATAGIVARTVQRLISAEDRIHAQLERIQFASRRLAAAKLLMQEERQRARSRTMPATTSSEQAKGERENFSPTGEQTTHHESSETIRALREEVRKLSTECDVWMRKAIEAEKGAEEVFQAKTSKFEQDFSLLEHRIQSLQIELKKANRDKEGTLAESRALQRSLEESVRAARDERDEAKRAQAKASVLVRQLERQLASGQRKGTFQSDGAVMEEMENRAREKEIEARELRKERTALMSELRKLKKHVAANTIQVDVEKRNADKLHVGASKPSEKSNTVEKSGVNEREPLAVPNSLQSNILSRDLDTAEAEQKTSSSDRESETRTKPPSTIVGEQEGSVTAPSRNDTQAENYTLDPKNLRDDTAQGRAEDEEASSQRAVENERAAKHAAAAPRSARGTRDDSAERSNVGTEPLHALSSTTSTSYARSAPDESAEWIERLDRLAKLTQELLQ